MSGVWFLGARLGRALLMILGVLVLSFLLVRLAPGDPAQLMAGEAGVDDAQYIAKLRSEMGWISRCPSSYCTTWGRWRTWIWGTRTAIRRRYGTCCPSACPPP